MAAIVDEIDPAVMMGKKKASKIWKDEGPPPAYIVMCRYGNINGGYLKDPERTEGDRPVYRNEEDSKDLWFSTGYVGGDKWVIGDTAGTGSFYVVAKPDDSALPHEADWTDNNQFSILPSPGPGDADAPTQEELEDEVMFVDPDFGAIPDSLGTADAANATWIRAPHLVAEGQVCRLFNKIEPNDIMQGSLGDCWLMSAIAGMAEFPSVIESELFMQQEVQPSGQYDISLYDPLVQERVTITISDKIPCHPAKWYDEKRPMFAQPNGNEMYVLLLEKAFAKFAGCYEKLNGGHSSLAWMVMTGCEDLRVYKQKPDQEGWFLGEVAKERFRDKPVFEAGLAYYNSSTPMEHDEFWQLLKSFDEANYIMSCSISGKVVEKERTDGLVERHAYALITATEVGEFKMVCARNPWGNGKEWNGAWCDTDAKWEEHPEVKEALGHEQRDDGLFWMEWADFKATFTNVEVCAKTMPTKRASHDK